MSERASARHRIRRSAVRMCAVLVAAAVTMPILGACAEDDSSADEVVLVTHDSFVLPDDVIDAFQKQTGLTLKVIKSGDGGRLATEVSLTPGSPKADAVFGVDNTFAWRPIEAGALDPYNAPAAADGSSEFAIAGSENLLTAVDRGDVCLNVDDTWYDDHGGTPPKSFRDLTDPTYAAQAALIDPRTSSPGLAFLLTTIAVLGDGWQHYWQTVKAGGAMITADWETAYNAEFSAGTGHGAHPIVLSYASSPAATAGTSAVLDHCYRQVEYIGVLKGARNVDGARKLVDFMLSPVVQKALPDAMYVYPVQKGTPLPDGWQQRAPVPESVVTLPPDYIRDNFEKWLNEWRAATGG